MAALRRDGPLGSALRRGRRRPWRRRDRNHARHGGLRALAGARTVLGHGAARRRAIAGMRPRRSSEPSSFRSIIAGERLLAFAHAESHSRYDLFDVDTRARRDGSSWIIDGHKRQRAARGLRRSAASSARALRASGATAAASGCFWSMPARAESNGEATSRRIACAPQISNSTASGSMPAPRSTRKAPRCRPSSGSSIARSRRCAPKRWGS